MRAGDVYQAEYALAKKILADAGRDEDGVYAAVSALLGAMEQVDELADLRQSFPALVVAGEQTSGKSRLIEAVVGARFTLVRRDVGTRMRFVINCQHVTHDEHGTHVTGPRFVFTRWDGVRAPLSGEFEVGDEEEMIRTVVEWQEMAVAQAGERRLADGTVRRRSFSNETITIKVRGPKCFNLTFIDLPGFRPASDDNVEVEEIVAHTFQLYERARLVFVERATTGDQQGLAMLRREMLFNRESSNLTHLWNDCFVVLTYFETMCTTETFLGTLGAMRADRENRFRRVSLVALDNPHGSHHNSFTDFLMQEQAAVLQYVCTSADPVLSSTEEAFEQVLSGYKAGVFRLLAELERDTIQQMASWITARLHDVERTRAEIADTLAETLQEQRARDGSFAGLCSVVVAVVRDSMRGELADTRYDRLRHCTRKTVVELAESAPTDLSFTLALAGFDEPITRRVDVRATLLRYMAGAEQMVLNASALGSMAYGKAKTWFMRAVYAHSLLGNHLDAATVHDAFGAMQGEDAYNAATSLAARSLSLDAPRDGVLHGDDMFSIIASYMWLLRRQTLLLMRGAVLFAFENVPLNDDARARIAVLHAAVASVVDHLKGQLLATMSGIVNVAAATRLQELLVTYDGADMARDEYDCDTEGDAAIALETFDEMQSQWANGPLGCMPDFMRNDYARMGVGVAANDDDALAVTRRVVRYLQRRMAMRFCNFIGSAQERLWHIPIERNFDRMLRDALDANENVARLRDEEERRLANRVSTLQGALRELDRVLLLGEDACRRAARA